MKKAAFLISAILAAGCGVPENAFLAEGYVPTLKDSTRLILTRFEGEMLIPVDTAHATNGRFSFCYPATGKGRLAILTFSDDVSDMFLPLWSAPRRESRHHGRQQLQAHMEREKPNPRTEGSRTIQTGRQKGIRKIAANFHGIPQTVEYARCLGRQHRR